MILCKSTTSNRICFTGGGDMIGVIDEENSSFPVTEAAQEAFEAAMAKIIMARWEAMSVEEQAKIIKPSKSGKS